MIEAETEKKEEHQYKDVYIRPNGQCQLLVPKIKDHPVKSLIEIFERNSEVLDITFLSESRLNRLISFITKITEYAQ